jgi:hypothetical protein
MVFRVKVFDTAEEYVFAVDFGHLRSGLRARVPRIEILLCHACGAKVACP